MGLLYIVKLYSEMIKKGDALYIRKKYVIFFENNIKKRGFKSQAICSIKESVKEIDKGRKENAKDRKRNRKNN